MPLNMYGREGVSQPLAQVTGGAQQAGRSVATKTFGAQAGSALKEIGRRERGLRNAIDTFGLQSSIQFSEQSDEMVDAIREDMREMRFKAQTARAQNDAEEYKLALEKIMFDKEMAARVDELGKTKISQLITGLIAGVGSVLGETLGGRETNLERVTQRQQESQSDLAWKDLWYDLYPETGDRYGRYK